MFRSKRTAIERERQMPEDTGGYPFDHDSTYPVAEIAAAWDRERPGVPTASIEIVTPIWRLAKLFADDRRRALRDAGVDPATLDLLSVLRRSGPPYRLTTRELTARSLVSAGAISQRLARAENAGLVERTGSDAHRRAVAATLTPAGHELVEHAVDRVLTREASLIAGLDPPQRDALADLLDHLDRAVRMRLGINPAPDGSPAR
jgi:DNA-binding MarR family transcriptional regulator